MKRQVISLILTFTAAFTLSACGKKEASKSSIVGDGLDAEPTAAAATEQSQDKSPLYDLENSPAKAATLAPAATESPEAAQKAQAKLDANNGTANAVVNSDSGDRKVDLHFSLENHTGIDFTALLLWTVDGDIKSASNVLPENQIFANNTSMDFNPESGTSLSTTLFNIAAVDSNGTGYVFQNIDLAANSAIGLYIQDNVPMAVMQ